jgi:hypothetical protein
MKPIKARSFFPAFWLPSFASANVNPSMVWHFRKTDTLVLPMLETGYTIRDTSP